MYIPPSDGVTEKIVFRKVDNQDNIETTFNAISCDGDTSTNDMVSIFATNKANNSEIKSYKDKKLKDLLMELLSYYNSF